MTALPKPKREKDAAYLEYVKSRNCILLGKFDHVCNGPVDPHHITPKMGGKVGSKPDDKRALPFCRSLHDVYHILGSIEAFEKRYPVILEYELRRCQREYRPPTKQKRDRGPRILRIDVACRCAQKTHRFSPSKVTLGEVSLSWVCPILRERIEVA